MLLTRVEDAFRDLKSPLLERPIFHHLHQVQTIVLPVTNGQTLRIRKGSTPDAIHREIYRTLQMPSEVMRPVKTWARTESR